MILPINYDKIPQTERRIVREEYIKLQNGNCCHCGGPLANPPPEKILKFPVNTKLFPTGFFNAPIHLHHNHDTGMTIGAIHNYCNAVMWQYYGK